MSKFHRLLQFLPLRRRYYDLYDEMAGHLAEKTDALIAAGVSPDEAAAAARRAFGPITTHEERGRAMWRAPWLEGVFSDFRFAARSLRKSPQLTIVAVLTLALGIGANTAMFSVVDAILLHPLPYKTPSRLAWLTQSLPGASDNNVSWPDFQDWRRQNHVFTDIAGYSDFPLTLNSSDAPVQLPARFVSGNYFALIGTRPRLGRTFDGNESRPGGPPVVVLSDSFWKSHFGAAANVVGQSLELNHKAWTVIGVMPPGFGAVSHTSLWVSFEAYVGPVMLSKRQFSWAMYAVARLRPGVSWTQARSDITAVSQRLERQYPTTTGGLAFMVPLTQRMVGNIRPALLLLFLAVSLLLLIACANIAGLLLVKAVGRQREMAVRIALGASRWRLCRQLMSESLILSATGAGLGLGLAIWGTHALVLLLPAATPIAGAITVNGAALLFTLCVSALAATLFGVAPALVGFGLGSRGLSKSGSRQIQGGPRRLQNALVVAEVGLATALLIGAGLLARSLTALFDVAPGFNTRNLLTEHVLLDHAELLKPAQAAAIFDQVVGRVRQLPGVEAAAAVSFAPFSVRALQPNWYEMEFAVQGQLRSAHLNIAHAAVVTPAYFHSMAIPLVAGRTFTAADTAGTLPVAVIDQTVARRFWPSSSPLGRQIKLAVADFADSSRPALTIVGVVGSIKSGGLDADTDGLVYGPAAQQGAREMTIVARTSVPPLTLAHSVAAAIHQAAPGSPISDTQTMEAMVQASQATRRLSLRLLGPIALAALLLAGLGLYGLISYLVRRSTSEIGVRMALGAQRADIVRTVLGAGMRLALIGILAGTVVALASTRFMASLLFEIKPADPMTFAGVAILLAAVAALACYLPARRGARTDPMAALRMD